MPTLFQAFETFIIDKRASGLSDHTIRNYRNTLAKLKRYWTEDKDIDSLTRSDWIGFMNWLQHEYDQTSIGIAERTYKALSPKSALNVHTDLSSFYSWAITEGVNVCTVHLFKQIDRPRHEPPPIETITKEQFAKLLAACDKSMEYNNKPGVSNTRPTRLRDRAILHTLLSTGIRASELCGLCYNDLHQESHSMRVAGKGRGRDSKTRTVYFGKSAHRALLLYLMPRIPTIKTNDYIFRVDESGSPRPFTRDVLFNLVSEIGERAGVHVYPHLFRHTFATEFLRNGGDLLKLQTLLGHTSLEMVRRYAHVVSADCQVAHAAADPADNWRVR